MALIDLWVLVQLVDRPQGVHVCLWERWSFIEQLRSYLPAAPSPSTGSASLNLEREVDYSPFERWVDGEREKSWRERERRAREREREREREKSGGLREIERGREIGRGGKERGREVSSDTLG